MEFKRYLCKDTGVTPPYMYFGERRCQILHTRLRLGCSSLNFDLFKNHLRDDDKCACGSPETTNISSLFVIIIIILEQLLFSKSKFRLTPIFCFAVAPCTITKLTERYSILYTSLLSAVVGLIKNYMRTQTLHSILFSFSPFFEHLFNFYT